MDITFFNRRQGDRFSIEKVTSSIIEEVASKNSVQIYDVPEIRASLPCIIKNILFVRSHKNKKGVNHITGDIHYCILGLIGCKKVLTIHDTVFLTIKQNIISYFIKWFLWLYLPCLLADKIICISEKTKDELSRHHISTRKVQVIYDPVTLSDVHKDIKPHIKTKILHVGTKPNKNLLRVIKSLAGLDCELTIIGQMNSGVEELLVSTNIDYKNKVGVSEGELAEEYVSADIVSFPSLYEGFGMPIVEGQLCDCAVLTSNIPPMTEVGLDSVLYVDPTSVDSIREGFKLLIENKQLRQQLIEKGRINAKRFSPEIISNYYLELYKTL